MNTQRNEADLLRTALLVNCVFSGLSGIILLFGFNRLSGFFGLHMPTILIGVGVLLLGYAVALLVNALRVTVCQTEAFLAVLLNIAWVVGSMGLLFAGSLSTLGNWTVTLAANIVLLFAGFQFYAIRRLRREGAVCELK
jgi:hypothetical protein